MKDATKNNRKQGNDAERIDEAKDDDHQELRGSKERENSVGRNVRQDNKSPTKARQCKVHEL